MRLIHSNYVFVALLASAGKGFGQGSPPPDDGFDYCCYNNNGCTNPCEESCVTSICERLIGVCRNLCTGPAEIIGNGVCYCSQDDSRAALCSQGPDDTFCPGGEATGDTGGDGGNDGGGDGGDGANGSGGGDPHFKTWSGSWYDYHGVCDLILARAREFGKGLGLDIHIRTKERYGYSFISDAVIRIGNSILQVSSFGQYSLDGIGAGADTPSLTMANLYNVTHVRKNKKEHVFTIQEKTGGTKQQIIITTFKDMVSVRVENALKADFVNAEGLMGSFHNGGKLVSRDGITLMSDLNAYGQEWQVLDTEPMLFQSVRAPQHPEKCIVPQPKTAEARRRLGESSISTEAAEEACAHWDEDKRDMCIFDVIAMNDFEVAQVHGAY